MNQLLCACVAVLLLLQVVSAQVSDEENRKLRERICNDPFHSFLCQTVDPTKRKRYGTKPVQNGGNLLGDNSFPQQSRLLPPQAAVPLPIPSTKKPEVVLQTTVKPGENVFPIQNKIPTGNLIPEAAQDSPVILKPKVSEDDLCKHSFHSFLCNPSKNSKRRLYNGQKPGSPPPKSNLLNGENSFLLSTQLRPDPPKIAPEPTLEPENSNDSPVFRGPEYLPPLGEKPDPNLFGDNSFLDPSQLLPSTTTPQPTTRKPTTQRLTTPRATTPRPTTPRATTPRPTTTTTRRSTTQRTTTEPNLQSEGAQNSGTQLRPEAPKVVPENLCAHSFHSFLCDKPTQSKRRRIYNGQKSSPENTNILGENSFQQPSRLLPPTTPAPKTTPPTRRTTPPTPRTTPPTPRTTTAYYKPVTKPTTTKKPASNLVGDNSFISPTNLRPPTTRKPVPTTPKPTPKPIPVKPEPDIQPDAAQSPSLRLKPDANGKDDDLCKHSFHSFLCNGGKSGGKRRVYNGQNSNILGSNSFLDSTKLLPPQTQPSRSTTYKPLFDEGSFIQPTNQKPEILNTASNTYLPPVPYLPPIFIRSKVDNPSTSNLIGANSNVEVTEVLPPTSRHLPASLTKDIPIATNRAHTNNAELQPAAAEAPSVVVAQPDNHHHDDSHDHGHHHEDGTNGHDDHHAAGAHGHGDHHAAGAHDHGDHHAAGAHGHGDHHGAHGDHHGDHHHHHHNITLEQLCRDPFHAFLCENVDTSKRRIYDGNPAQGTPSARERLQGAGSVAQSTLVNAPRNNPSPNSLQNNFYKPRPSVPVVPHSPNPVTHQPLAAVSSTYKPPSYSSPATFVPQTTTTRPPYILQLTTEQVPNVYNNENLSLYIRKDSPLLRRRIDTASSVQESPEASADFNQRVRNLPEVPGAHLLFQPSQRLPALRQSQQNHDTTQHQVGNRERRPLRRRTRPQSAEAEGRANNQEFRLRENAPIPESVNRRSDDVDEQERRPQRIRFGDKLPRRKRLNTQEGDLSFETPTNPAGFVRGPRGVASHLAASTPDVRCKEPFNAYQCRLSVEREKREAKGKGGKEGKEDKEEDDVEVEEGRRTVNMRDEAQGHEREHGKGKNRERIRMKIKGVDKKETEEIVVREEVMEDESVVRDVSEDKKGVTTEDPVVVYQRGIDEELKRREEEENNRKEELKRREEDMKNRKDELTRREKEKENRKAEARRRKEEIDRRKAEDKVRKEMMKKLKEAEKHDKDEDEEDADDSTDDDEEKKEGDDKEKMLEDYQKSVVAELKRREEEVTRREGELKRREDELKRREEDGKQREAEIERRKVQEKKNEEEKVRIEEQKVRIAEEMIRRQEEDDRRAAAKELLEASKKVK